ncbi:MAG: hypothetical protein ACOYH4_03515 [Saccharofermentanales bacterium]
MTDRDFISDIKATEAEAASRIEAAREEAQQKRQETRRAVADRLDAAYQEADALRQTAMDDAERKYRALTKETSSDMSAASGISNEALDQTASILAERIVSLLEYR